MNWTGKEDGKPDCEHGNHGGGADYDQLPCSVTLDEAESISEGIAKPSHLKLFLFSTSTNYDHVNAEVMVGAHDEPPRTVKDQSEGDKFYYI